MPAYPDHAYSALQDLSDLAATLAPSLPSYTSIPIQNQNQTKPIPISITSPGRIHHDASFSSSYSTTPSLSPYDHAAHFSASYTSTASAASTLSTTTASVVSRPVSIKHRRQSSNGHRRRLSDARESLAVRPFLQPSPFDSPPEPPSVSQSLPNPPLPLAKSKSKKHKDHKERKEEKDKDSAGSGNGKSKKPATFVCGECNKVYRHRSCMDKHRWEHSPHWLPSSKFLLSKHQQVQLLEAAAILSHLPRPGGRSLPDDRALWPSYLAELSATRENEYLEVDDDDEEEEDVDMSVSGRGAEDDDETEDEIEVGWEGVGGHEMEL